MDRDRLKIPKVGNFHQRRCVLGRRSWSREDIHNVRTRPIQSSCNWLICLKRSHVVEYLKNLVKSKPKTYVTYLYCDYKRTANFSATALFGAIVRQLLPQLNALPSDAARFMREAKVRLGRPTARLDEIRTVLEFLRSSVSKLYVCIDALDECNEDEGFVDACGKIPFSTSFCFIGRSSIVHTVRRTFPKVRGYAIRTQTDDIRAFVASRVEADRAHQPGLMPKSLEDEILKEIPSLANGM